MDEQGIEATSTNSEAAGESAAESRGGLSAGATIGIAFFIGSLCFLIAFMSAWRQSDRTLLKNTVLIAWTNRVIYQTSKHIEQLVDAGLPPPERLNDISSDIKYELYNPPWGFSVVRNGHPVDGWGRPLLYSTDGTTYTLTSLGCDGRPGGVAFDRDLGTTIPPTDIYRELSSWSEDTPPATLHQFLFELPSGGMIMGCAVTGLLGFGLSFFLIGIMRVVTPDLRALVVPALITLGVSVCFGQLIMIMHIPSGH